MRTFIKSIALAAVITLVSCVKDEGGDNPGNLSGEDVSISSRMDAISNDVSEIAEDQLAQQSAARMSGTSRMNPPSILPSCATVTTVVANNVWTSTIDFGTTGCQYYNGAILKGIIIVSGSTNFAQSPYTWTYNFNNFYYNNIKVEGTKVLSRVVQATSLLATPHPVVTIDLNLHFTFPNGNQYDRTGTRVRELVEGYDTPLVFNDNVYLVTGSWITAGSSSSHLTTILTPLRFVVACQYKLTEGSFKVERNSHTAVVNYGDGTCDNNATVSYDGGTPIAFTFIFGN
ncbi:hypothetical protein LZZ90_04315 [Flavobacterium sp. SM15]|uniref:hypothetical protein n=1 Tax=Flavobacterium sp. SM15 TaxID=2908005 RepID=UPI001EDA5430|nr:hypothetical protein [Flavobacterium sp. SM15]MCG2610726.1 hypothetical protein [Flavobacterium sp. SM15]